MAVSIGTSNGSWLLCVIMILKERCCDAELSWKISEIRIDHEHPIYWYLAPAENPAVRNMVKVTVHQVRVEVCIVDVITVSEFCLISIGLKDLIEIRKVLRFLRFFYH